MNTVIKVVNKQATYNHVLDTTDFFFFLGNYRIQVLHNTEEYSNFMTD